MPGLPAACACLRQPEHLTIPALTSLSLERPTVPALVSPSPGAPSKVPVPISSWGARADGQRMSGKETLWQPSPSSIPIPSRTQPHLHQGQIQLP